MAPIGAVPGLFLPVLIFLIEISFFVASFFCYYFLGQQLNLATMATQLGSQMFFLQKRDIT